MRIIGVIERSSLLGLIDFMHVHAHTHTHAYLSAGVGRTGTLICIDVELQRARQEGLVDPFNFTLQMRQQRNHMVQTEVMKPLLSCDCHVIII